MKRVSACIVGFSLLVPVLAWGDVASLHRSTAASPDSRYEIVQSQLAARWTFRLDRYTGEVMQLVLSKEKQNMWAKVPVQDLPVAKGAARPRYQIFTSGLAAKHTFLLDTATGRTWTLIFDLVSENNAEAEIPVFKPFQ